jgi:uncharacterized membrane protein YbaN (DUF454 family)
MIFFIVSSVKLALTFLHSLTQGDTICQMKIILNLIGCLAVVLGVLGIFLPLLPTTPFLLLASACFARGSTRMHHWLQTNRVFGKYLRDYENGKGIPLRGKVWVLIFMWSLAGLFDLAPGTAGVADHGGGDRHRRDHLPDPLRADHAHRQVSLTTPGCLVGMTTTCCRLTCFGCAARKPTTSATSPASGR